MSHYTRAETTVEQMFVPKQRPCKYLDKSDLFCQGRDFYHGLNSELVNGEKRHSITPFLFVEFFCWRS